MSESKVQGKNVILTAYNVDDYYGFYCAQSVELTITTDQLPSTNINGGGFKGYKPGKTGWEINLSGVLFVRDTSDKNWTHADLTSEQSRKNGLDLKIVYTNENGHYEQFTGHGNPESTTGTGEAGQLAKFNVRFVGDGAFTRNAIIPPSTTSDVKRYEYTAVGSETSFSYADLIGRTILEVQREATPTLAIITVGTPNPKQALYTSSTGTIAFDTALDPAELVIILYK